MYYCFLIVSESSSLRNPINKSQPNTKPEKTKDPKDEHSSNHKKQGDLHKRSTRKHTARKEDKIKTEHHAMGSRQHNCDLKIIKKHHRRSPTNFIDL